MYWTSGRFWVQKPDYLGWKVQGVWNIYMNTRLLYVVLVCDAVQYQKVYKSNVYLLFVPASTFK